MHQTILQEVTKRSLEDTEGHTEGQPSAVRKTNVTQKMYLLKCVRLLHAISGSFFVHQVGLRIKKRLSEIGPKTL